MTIKEILSRPAVFVVKGSTVREAIKKMQEGNVGTIVIVNNEKDKKACGILTDRDVALHLLKNPNIEGVNIDEIMSSSLVILRGDESIKKLSTVMAENKIRRVIVSDDNNNVLGVASLDDLILLLVSELDDLKKAIENQICRI